MGHRKFNLAVLAVVMSLALAVAGCTPVEVSAYRTVVGAKAFLDSMKAQHQECATGAVSTMCDSLKRATGAKDALITAIEIYCAGPQFAAGGPCNAPAKGTPTAQQALAKLQAAISNYQLIEVDVRKAVGK